MKDLNEKRFYGRVIERLPNLEFRVETKDNPNEAGGSITRCILSGKMKMNKILVSVGDTVEFVQAGHVGRIIKRK